jgi:putative flippase GtrA
LRGDGVHHQALRFLLVGGTTVAIDFVVYVLLHRLGLPLTPAKTVSFVVATVCAYVFNRTFTFGARGGTHVALRFTLLYAAALLCNVGVNAVMLSQLPEGRVGIVVAFLCAQAVSSTLNFVGMRYVVFTDPAHP